MLLSSCVHIQTSKYFTLVKGVDLFPRECRRFTLQSRGKTRCCGCARGLPPPTFSSVERCTNSVTLVHIGEQPHREGNFIQWRVVCVCVWVLCTFSFTLNKHLESRRSRWCRDGWEPKGQSFRKDTLRGASAILPQSFWEDHIFLWPPVKKQGI